MAFIIETLTDNKNRSASSIRTILQKNGGRLGELGSTSHLFNNCGVIQINKNICNEEIVFELATNSGAKDFISTDKYHEILCKKDDFYKVKNETQKLAKDLIYSAIEWRPKNPINLQREESLQLENLLEVLQEDDDIQNVFHNCKFL